MLIFAASNDEAHFSGDIAKGTGDYPGFWALLLMTSWRCRYH
jgi:hypothetical protein